ncbi:MAG: response regulator [Balneolaceae bacterium]|nr:response regulator [Balneolaceae bacterium]MCH8548240.1 response regulator [Balneolaceae bacterium]
MLIEDSADDAILTIRALKKLNFQNITVSDSGREAVRYLYHENVDDLPDLIILDLNLTIVDGLTILKRLRSEKKTRHIPVIIFSSSGEEQDIQKSYEYGANSYVRKPVDFTEFEDLALCISNYWLRFNRAPASPQLA